MMAAPSNISINEIKSEIERIDDIHNVHHIHLWRINERDVHFEAHVKVPDLPVSSTEELLSEIERVLAEKFNIHHVTIQFECDRCREE